jgi:hypothetical protein
MFSDQQKLGSEPLVCHRSRLASRFLRFNVLQIRARRPPARPKLATRDYSRLSCGVADTQLGPGF